MAKRKEEIMNTDLMVPPTATDATPQAIPIGVEEMAPHERATVAPPQNGTATVRRKAKRGRTDRTYWVCGRRSPGSPVQHIMPQETVGRARKMLETVRLMPAYDGWELWATRETKVS